MDVERDCPGAGGAGRRPLIGCAAAPAPMAPERLAALRALVARGIHNDPAILMAAADRIRRSGDLGRVRISP